MEPKVLLKALWSVNPLSNATWGSGRFDRCNRAFALSTRCAITYRCTVTPNDRLKDRAKWLTESPHSPARWASLSSPTHCASIISVTRRFCHGASPPQKRGDTTERMP